MIKKLLVALVFSISSLLAHKAYVCADTWGEVFVNGRVEMGYFKLWCEGQGIALEQKTLREVLADDFQLQSDEKIIFFDQLWDRFSPETFDKFRKFPKNCSALVVWESPVAAPLSYSRVVHQYFGTIFTFYDNLIDKVKYRKIYLPSLVNITPKQDIPFNEKKFLVAVFNNKDVDPIFRDCLSAIRQGSSFLLSEKIESCYWYRKAFIEYFQNKDLDLYGVGWTVDEYYSYKGLIEPTHLSSSKIDVISKYKFVFACENVKGLTGYISEKLFDVMLAGSVPIFPDFNNVSKYIPKHCYIDPQDFNSFGDLNTFLMTMTEEQYEQYRSNIRAFLRSPQAEKFRMGSLHAILQDYILGNLWII